MSKRIAVRIVLAIMRAVVFLLGIVCGYLSAAVVSSFGGSAAVDFTGVFFGIGLMVAAPICWVAAVRCDSGDRWTLAYMGTWIAYLCIAVIIDVIEGGKPITGTNDAGNVALVLLAILYLVVLPAGVIVYRKRRE
jgi:hypothetical protein